MCAHCDQEAESMRPVVDELLAYMRTVAGEDDSRTPTQKIVGCANVIVHMHSNADNMLTVEAVRALACEYATVVMRLIAMEQLSGITS